MRPHVVERDGRKWEFRLDIAAIVEAERADPSYSFLEDVASLGERPRLASLDRICGFIGTDLATMAEDGFVMADIPEILEGCLANAGFRPRRRVDRNDFRGARDRRAPRPRGGGRDGPHPPAARTCIGAGGRGGQEARGEEVHGHVDVRHGAFDARPGQVHRGHGPAPVGRGGAPRGARVPARGRGRQADDGIDGEDERWRKGRTSS